MPHFNDPNAVVYDAYGMFTRGGLEMHIGALLSERHYATSVGVLRVIGAYDKNSPVDPQLAREVIREKFPELG